MPVYICHLIHYLRSCSVCWNDRYSVFFGKQLEEFRVQNFQYRPFSVQQREVSLHKSDMEVKLSISSSRRISFASDFKDIDLEVEELENERDNPTHYRGRVSYINSDSDDDVESNYVNAKRLCHIFHRKLGLTLSAIAKFFLFPFSPPKARKFFKENYCTCFATKTNKFISSLEYTNCRMFSWIEIGTKHVVFEKKMFFCLSKANRFRLL